MRAFFWSAGAMMPGRGIWQLVSRRGCRGCAESAIVNPLASDAVPSAISGLVARWGHVTTRREHRFVPWATAVCPIDRQAEQSDRLEPQLFWYHAPNRQGRCPQAILLRVLAGRIKEIQFCVITAVFPGPSATCRRTAASGMTDAIERGDHLPHAPLQAGCPRGKYRPDRRTHVPICHGSGTASGSRTAAQGTIDLAGCYLATPRRLSSLARVPIAPTPDQLQVARR